MDQDGPQSSNTVVLRKRDIDKGRIPDDEKVESGVKHLYVNNMDCPMPLKLRKKA